VLLNVHKPAGFTSRDAVNKVQRLVYPLKCGHAGTLDPLATGVLLICVGKGTRLVPYLHELPKAYVATFLAGRRSDTEDIEAAVELLPDAPQFSVADLHAQLPQFLGDIWQVPPRFSALNVGGERAYSLARRGETVDLAPRKIRVHALEVLSCQDCEFRLKIVCSTGTYIRSLGRDIARALGTECVMTALDRTAIGPFEVSQSVSLAELSRENTLSRSRPLAEGVRHFPTTVLTGEAAQRVRLGQPLTRNDALYPPLIVQPPQFPPEHVSLGTRREDWIAAVDEQGRLLAFLEPRTAHYWAVQVFAERDAVC
jgi:tRNA pseudouridine55 synthase